MKSVITATLSAPEAMTSGARSGVMPPIATNGTLPIRWAERSEIHPVVEEMYLLAGEVHGDRGIMRPGAYFWRPPFVPHGPYGTQTGNLYFFRTRGGGLSTASELTAKLESMGYEVGLLGWLIGNSFYILMGVVILISILRFLGVF